MLLLMLPAVAPAAVALVLLLALCTLLTLALPSVLDLCSSSGGRLHAHVCTKYMCCIEYAFIQSARTVQQGVLHYEHNCVALLCVTGAVCYSQQGITSCAVMSQL
jgi:hypothetical protein